MGALTIDEIKQRHARLVVAREVNQKEIRKLQVSLEDAQRREHGFIFVLGELESMVAELTARDAEQEEADRRAAELAAADAERIAQAERDAAKIAEALRQAAEDTEALPHVD